MIGAVVIGGHVQGLSIIRSLGRRGIPVTLFDSTSISISRFSKYCENFARIPFTANEDTIAEQLESAGRQLGLEGAVVFPTNDMYVSAISKHVDRLSETFRIITPKWETIQGAYDKRMTYQLAQDAGVPMPATVVPSDMDDLHRLGQTVDYPILLKPAVMHKFYRLYKRKVLAISDYDELIRIVNKIENQIPVDELMLQEIIPGHASNILSFGSFYKSDSEWIAHTNRHTRQIPMDFGTVATLVEFSKSQEIVDLGLKFLNHIGYYGISEIEFKYDERDKQYKMLEMNPRSWKQIGLGIIAGNDLPYYAYRDATGQKNHWCGCMNFSDMRWIDFMLDFYTSVGELFRGRLKPSIYLSSLKKPRVFAVLSKDDIRPFLMELLLFPLIWSKR